MKKFLFVALVSFGFLFLFSHQALAAACTVKPGTCDDSCVDAGGKGIIVAAGGANTTGTRSGLVPCGISCQKSADDTTRVSCDTAGSVPGCSCTLSHGFVLISNVYTFIAWDIAAPLAGLLIVLGGLFLLLSGANQKMHDLGKQLLWGAVWGIALIFGAYIIIKIVLLALGYTGISF